MTVGYELTDTVATLTMDDGKVNVLGLAMQAALNEALDRAEADEVKALVLAGNGRVFSGGFDLEVFQSGDKEKSLQMLSGGFELAARLLSFRAPVVMAATGPAIAMGGFLLLAGDHLVGQPKTRCQAIEVAIGMTMPYAALEIMKYRLTPAAYQRANALATTFTGDAAIAAGWLDEIVEADRVVARAQEFAAEAAKTIHTRAHRDSKLKARGDVLKGIRAGIESLPTEFTLL
ncbi:enoyl-CoA hydratase [Mycolicibacterium phlei]|jgi:enoyl-CoA hydratase|uniref:Enoyl-CoA hydratase n=1 Tax=Mycolicibacterium phlei DSM 43239 = CCUG 21000 TaxID=1226750 RepID=A0A5N5V7G4_MYCPH|nr:crotonase/enoyl-CoA hydratase family protein [Mycolicibacterium phlei]VEG08136.1 enoyl-CoA hydratase [Mycobacteroides chelonae]AMO60013.1 putative enoyl-CoA hydratase [Mycolicibacterium phlei]EID14748.1 enoyl-CoA hydratase [Mycolicibacterium phlei RIVM601174]KAB7757785.1 enoyl-CoA hydratase [Mycolicibacterium phlei DSM 43239 = CCUG 21000]KXW61342.1 enoyl-CoA hydratase [Mycolicibacterium phlei DSM 43239 = CCUG 21000]